MVCLVFVGGVSSGSAAFICSLGESCPTTVEQDDCCNPKKACSQAACDECCSVAPNHAEDAPATTPSLVSFELTGILPEGLPTVAQGPVFDSVRAVEPLEISLPNAPPPRKASRAPPSPAI